MKDTIVMCVAVFCLGFGSACAIWSTASRTVVITQQTHACAPSMTGDALICTKK